MTDIFGPVIHRRTRAKAIAVGDLIEVEPELVSDARLRYPVALTRAAWLDCVKWDERDAEETGAIQDEEGRLSDVLMMTRLAAASASGAQAVATLHRVPRGIPYQEDTPDGIPGADTADDISLVHLLVTIGPDDDGAPCLTVSLPGED